MEPTKQEVDEAIREVLMNTPHGSNVPNWLERYANVTATAIGATVTMRYVKDTADVMMDPSIDLMERSQETLDFVKAAIGRAFFVGFLAGSLGKEKGWDVETNAPDQKEENVVEKRSLVREQLSEIMGGMDKI